MSNFFRADNILTTLNPFYRAGKIIGYELGNNGEAKAYPYLIDMNRATQEEPAIFDEEESVEVFYGMDYEGIKVISVLPVEDPDTGRNIKSKILLDAEMILFQPIDSTINGNIGISRQDIEKLYNNIKDDIFDCKS